jgi:hypothetical protein
LVNRSDIIAHLGLRELAKLSGRPSRPARISIIP